MATYYIQTNVFCFAVLIIVSLLLNKRNIVPARSFAFRTLVFVCAVICVSDMFAWLLIGQQFPRAKHFLYFFNMVYYFGITWEGYAWLEYVNLNTKSLEENYRRRRLLDIVPLMIMLLLVLTTPLTKFLFSVSDDAVYQRGPGIWLHWLISWGYLIYTTIRVIISIRHTDSILKKNELRPLLWFVIPPVISALVQMISYGISSLQCGLTVSILIIAFSYLSEEVSVDSLTGLNNRRTLEYHLSDQLQKSRIPVTILMCDVDCFKHINDTLGHAAGDLVLKRMAASLKKVCGNYDHDILLCRYGGDEFVICGFNLSTNETNRIVDEIERSIETMNADYSDDLFFRVSVGTSSSVCADLKDVEGLIGLADAAMYESKRNKKEISKE